MASNDTLGVLRAHLGLVISTILIGVACAVVAFVISPPLYSASSSVMLVSEENGRDPSATSIDMPALLLTDTVLTRTQHRLDNSESLQDFRKRVSAVSDLQSSIMPISYIALTPSAAVIGANTLADELRSRYREISASRYDDLSRYLGTALTHERRRITGLDRQIAILIQQDPYLAQQNAGEAISAEIVGLDQQKSALQATLESHALAESLARQRISAVRVLASNEILASDSPYQAMMGLYAHDSADAQVVRAQYTPNYPGLPGLVDELNRTRAVIAKERVRALDVPNETSPSYSAARRDFDNAHVALEADRATVAQIDSSIEEASRHLAHEPDLGVRLSGLKRDRDAAATAYGILAEQQTITLAQQAEAAALSSVVIVDLASQGERARGRAAALLPIATLVGFAAIALGLPFVLELTDTRLRRRATIEDLYGKPLIARL